MLRPMAPPRQHALRRGRISIPGQAYLLTSVCADRRRWFGDDDIDRLAGRVITSPRVWEDATLLAWVLMPDHWHGLVTLGSSRGVSSLMQRMKAVTSREVSVAFGVHPLWEAGFHDHAMRTEEDVRVAARYVVANPIRAGLVTELCDYPHWGSRWGMDSLQDPFA
jgi:REP element-mobilizing transposase RayT